MSRLDPQKLYVTLGDGVTKISPIYGRKYTLTHSDETGELFLFIGLQYAYYKITEMRDEVLAVWVSYQDHPALYVYVYVDGEFGPARARIRNQIFQRELPLALEAIRFGDDQLFQRYPKLDQAPILIHFDSSYPKLNRIEDWGSFDQINKLP